MSVRNSSVAGLLGAAMFAASAGASTLHEGAGNFSNDWAAPTVVASGTTGVSGTGAPDWTGGDRFDVFHFAGLLPGATSVVFDFSLSGPYPANAYANGGGTIYYSYVPFTGAYYVDRGNGNVLGGRDLLAGDFDVTYNPWDAANPSSRGTSTFTLGLGEDFGGDLFLALDFTYGNQVSYNVNSLPWVEPANGSAPNPIPLPAAGWLMIAGFSGLGLVASRRKRR